MGWKDALDEALGDAFTLAAFLRLLSYKLSQNTNDYAGLDYPSLRLTVINAAEAGGSARELVRAALASNPDNRRLTVFRETYPEFAPAILKETEIAALEAGLSGAFPTYDDLAALIDRRLRDSLDAMIERGVGPPPDDYLRRVIAWYDRRGDIIRLIDAALQAGGADPVLKAKAHQVRSALRAREAASGYRRPDPFDACLINQRVFINRKMLRCALRSLSPSPRKPILAVNGPARSGKSYSLELIRYVASEQRGLEVASIDLKEEQHARFRPNALARSIILQMGRPQQAQFMPKEEEAGSAARWAQELCDWLIGEARQSGKTWIIALDGFYHPDLPVETRDMVRELVKRAAPAGSPLRIVLIHYTDDLLPVDVRPRVEPERLQPITRVELSEFLSELAGQNGITVEDGAIDDLVDVVITKIPSGEIAAIADEVQRWADELTGREADGNGR